MRQEGLPPVINPTSKILIVGTMPGKKSLEQKQYYADSRNQFWSIIFSVLEKPMPFEYQQKVAQLLESKIALWDVLASCTRAGSLDRDISNAVVNDFSTIFKQYPHIKVVAFNGKRAERLWNKLVKIAPNIEFITMPSTSRALARPFEEKLMAWSELKRYL